MTGAIVTGLFAAFFVNLAPWIQLKLPEVFWPIMIPGMAAFAMLLQGFVLDRRSSRPTYDGIADLFIQIQAPTGTDTALRWGIRGFISFLLAIVGGEAGVEGAAVEFGHALALATRPRSARWFERRRRTDAGTALAAGISAAFGAPFTGFLLPTELGIGGRAIPVVVGSLVAYVAGRWAREFLGLGAPDLVGAVSGAVFFDPRAWAGACAIGALAGLAGAGLVWFFRYAQESLFDLFQTRAWTRTLCAGVLLFLVAMSYRAAHAPLGMQLEQAVWARFSIEQAWALFFAASLSLSMVLAGFGTVGVFWPLLVIGVYFGTGICEVAFRGFEVPVAVMGFAGAAAFWGAVLGAPVSGAVLAFELTQNFSVLLPCLAAGAIAVWVRQKIGVRSLIQSNLEARGMGVVEGRAREVLSAISVRDAMVVDHETVREQEPVSEIYPRLLKSRYPFLPVVTAQGGYAGLLTVDLVQEAWLSQSGHSNSPLSKLLEAKDLLYRGGFKGPTIQVGERLSATEGIFDTVPCVPVLSEDGRVVGLLFVHNVRLAYDREMARRSLVTEE